MRSSSDHRAEFADFTEEGYRNLLRTAKTAYRFARFGDTAQDRHILWRHDLDASLHRALRLAQIEQEEGVVATYFLYPRCRYYNIFSTEVAEIVRQISDLGHDLGLHFDPTHYGDLDRTGYDNAVARERDWLQDEFRQPLTAISFHLFGVLKNPAPSDDRVCGLVNAYGVGLRTNYGYVSDSNGVWLYRRLIDVLRVAEEPKLQVLTHPEWWTPEVMPPRARLQRAIDGYAAALGQWYDDIVGQSGRPNLRE